jgi:hypothetical protein
MRLGSMFCGRTGAKLRDKGLARDGWRFGIVFAVFLAALAAPAPGFGVSCTTQAEMSVAERDAVAGAGQRFAMAVVQQDYTTLQGALLPAVVQQWDGIRSAVEDGAPLVKGGQIQLRSLYLLDASSLTAPADTQFFCSNANGSLTVTISMRGLPQGRYAVVLADALGAPLAGQMAFILGWDANAWKLGGVSLRPGMLEGHDGVWYWQHARELSKENASWAAWFCYETARYLLVPVDFLSSPNLEKLGQEQAQIRNSPAEAFPYSLPDGARTWKIDSIRLDTSLRHADLAVTYESTGVTDPAAVRTEAVAVMGALLKAQPALRDTFHGLWAYASKDGKVSPVMELPMEQIK